MPPNVFLGRVLLGVHQHLHALIIKRIRLAQVQDVEPNSTIVASIRNSKEEPLSISTCVDVIL